MSALTVQSLVLSSCTICQAGTEFIHRNIEGGIHLATFLSFLMISTKGILLEKRLFGAPQHIPTRKYWSMVTIFFIVNLCNNYSLYFDVSMPLFIIFKSGSLLANLLLTWIIRRQVYPFSKILAIIVTTIGLAIFTIASSTRKPQWVAQPPEWVNYIPVSPFWIGVILMSTALFLSAYLGIMQEDLFRTYGRHHEEALFFVHFLSLPAFALVGDSLLHATSGLYNVENVIIGGYDVPVWFLFFASCALQLICAGSVFRLASVSSSLDVTMLLSIRKGHDARMHNMNQQPHPGMPQHQQSPLMSALGGPQGGMDGNQSSQGPPGMQEGNFIGGGMRPMQPGGGPMRGPVGGPGPIRQQPMMQMQGRLPPYMQNQGPPQRPGYSGPPPPHQGPQGSPMPIIPGRIVQQPGPLRQQPYPVQRPGMPMSSIPQPQHLVPRQITGPPPNMPTGSLQPGAPMPRGASPAPPRPQAFQPPVANPPPSAMPQVLDGKAALIDKSRLDKIVQEIDPRLVLDDAVKEALIEMSDEFVSDLIEKVCVLAQHRGKVSVASGDNNHRLEVRDAEFVLNTVYKMPHPPRAAVHVFGSRSTSESR
ncbi:unnamed protein product, partial [Mesorhabditis belari]|uniref:Transcription initiation factor TFIID subunit 12 n=1 Tax=Mesorhabditis belari TaxID=2138241 RepID=A0AAF3EE02_9BILA